MEEEQKWVLGWSCIAMGGAILTTIIGNLLVTPVGSIVTPGIWLVICIYVLNRKLKTWTQEE